MSIQFTPGGAAELNFFIPLVKVDEEKRLIYARAAQEIPDKAKEIMDYASAKPAFQQWSDHYSQSTNGLSKGNVRVMHTKTVAGRLNEIQFNDDDKAIDVCMKIVDDNEWRKCLEGCYTGVSVGGGYGPKWPDKQTGLTRYTPVVREISLVDNPCIPTARFAELVKADGMVGQIELRGNVRTFADMWGARPQTFAEQWAARPVTPMTFGELQKDAAAAAALAASQRGGWLPTFSTYSTGQSKPKKPRNTSRVTMRNAYVASRPLGLSGKYNRALPATPKQPATLGKAYTESKHKRAKDGEFAGVGGLAGVGAGLYATSGRRGKAIVQHAAHAGATLGARYALHRQGVKYRSRPIIDPSGQSLGSKRFYDVPRGTPAGHYIPGLKRGIQRGGTAGALAAAAIGIAAPIAGGYIGRKIGGMFDKPATPKPAATLKKAYAESKHKRAKDGRFATLGGEIGASVGSFAAISSGRKISAHAMHAGATLGARMALHRAGIKRKSQPIIDPEGAHLGRQKFYDVPKDVGMYSLGPKLNSGIRSGGKYGALAATAANTAIPLAAWYVGKRIGDRFDDHKRPRKKKWGEEIGESVGRAVGGVGGTIAGFAAGGLKPAPVVAGGLVGALAGKYLGGGIGYAVDQRFKKSSRLRASARKHAAA